MVTGAFAYMMIRTRTVHTATGNEVTELTFSSVWLAAIVEIVREGFFALLTFASAVCCKTFLVVTTVTPCITMNERRRLPAALSPASAGEAEVHLFVDILKEARNTGGAGNPGNGQRRRADSTQRTPALDRLRGAVA